MLPRIRHAVAIQVARRLPREVVVVRRSGGGLEGICPVGNAVGGTGIGVGRGTVVRVTHAEHEHLQISQPALLQRVRILRGDEQDLLFVVEHAVGIGI